MTDHPQTLHSAAGDVVAADKGKYTQPLREALAGLRDALERDSQRKAASATAPGKPRGRKRKIDRDRVARLLASGMSCAAVARQLGCAPSAITAIRAALPDPFSTS